MESGRPVGMNDDLMKYVNVRREDRNRCHAATYDIEKEITSLSDAQEKKAF